MQFYPQHNSFSFNLVLKQKCINISEPKVFGVLNITPDSFYDGGTLKSDRQVLKRVEQMIKEGAWAIDIGGYSTRPGAEFVNEETELERVIPIVQKIRKKFPDIYLSIDTFRSKVAYEAYQVGIDMVNDVTAGEHDDLMPDIVAKLQVPYIIMHKQGNFSNMQQNPQYNDVTMDVGVYLAQKSKDYELRGVHDIIIDLGFGFGKNLTHNYMLLRSIKTMLMLGKPIMVGVSRKRMIYEVLKVKPKEALNGTTILNTISLLQVATFLRVHDVKEAIECVKLTKEYLGDF
jgi:dihydropteroate synthase